MSNTERLSGSKKEELSKYPVLREAGFTLADIEIDYLVNHLKMGVDDAKEYLGRTDDQWFDVQASVNGKGIGYAGEEEFIDFPMHIMLELCKSHTPLSQRYSTIGYRSDEFTHIERIPMSNFFILTGREEYLHRAFFQNDPHFTAKHEKTDSTAELDVIDRLLWDFEVEAREMVDDMSIKKDKRAWWKNLNEALKTKYPERYNKSLKYLLSNPRNT